MNALTEQTAENTYYRFTLIKDMTREELIAALLEMSKLLNERDAEHARTLDVLLG